MHERARAGRRTRGFLLLGLAAWLSLNAYVAVRCRFWINSDTVGSLDAARSLRAFDLSDAVNGYFGTGFAILLAPLNLRDLSSFLSVHLLTLALLLATQAMLYLALRTMTIERGVAVLLTMIWAAACYASGCAVYVTADIALCLWAGAYVLLVMKHVTVGGETPWVAMILLGTLHAVAGITKAIAFPTLLLLPVGLAVAAAVHDRRAGVAGGLTLRRIASGLLPYFAPLVILSAGWSLACQARYGSFTFGGTASYNYALYTLESEDLQAGIERARQHPTAGKSFWWSDPTLSVEWNRSLEIDPARQVGRLLGSSAHYLSGGKQSIRAAVFTCLVLISLPALGWGRSRRAMPCPAWLLGLVAWSSVLAHASTVLYPRHLAYPALLCLPIAAVVIAQLRSSRRTIVRGGVAAALVLALTHGVAAMLYAAETLAPGNEHFVIADVLSREADGPIGVHLAGEAGLRSYGAIAFLTGREAAELVPVEDGGDVYRATFEPAALLLVVEADAPPPVVVTVNGRRFQPSRQDQWAGGSHDTVQRIVTYLPDDPS